MYHTVVRTTRGILVETHQDESAHQALAWVAANYTATGMESVDQVDVNCYRGGSHDPIWTLRVFG